LGFFGVGTPWATSGPRLCKANGGLEHEVCCNPKDVVRHPLVQRIVEAYERFEASQAPFDAKVQRHD
jgi:hypothetical protein